LAAINPTRIGSLFWAERRLGAAMLAIPAPATPETNCRRDIVIKSSRERYQIGSCYFLWRDLSDGSHK
jgi:hypothetical protein